MGITPEMIKRGMVRMAADLRYSNWPPAAIEFRLLCLPTGEDMGLPPESDAFAQAVGNRTSKHPAVVLTLREYVDGHALRRMPDIDARRAWTKAWAQTVEHVATGGSLPEVALEIEDKPVKADPEAVSNHRAALKGLFA